MNHLPRPSEIVAQFAINPQTATLYTASMLEVEFNALPAQDRPTLRTFLRDTVAALLTAANLDYLQTIVQQVHARHVSAPALDLTKFGLSTDMPSVSELQNALRNLYTEVSALATDKEECQHYLVLLKSLGDTLHSASRAITTFVCDEDLHTSIFQSVGERKRYAETQTADLEAAKQRITTLRQVLTTITDDILAPRNQILMRSDSALRLVVKLDEVERGLNRGQSGTDTEPRGTPPSPFARPQGGFGDPEVEGI
jgi:hypothetical protein